MKLKILLLIAVVALLLPSRVSAEENERDIIYQQTANLYGGSEDELIVLSGVKKNDTTFFEDIKITVFDNLSGKLIKTFIPTINYGFEPKITLIDFDLDGVLEVFYSSKPNIKDESGCFYALSFEKDDCLLYDFEVDVTPISARYKNYYKVEVKAGSNSYLVDISYKPKNYLNKLYNSNGKLYKECRLSISCVLAVYPYYNYSDNLYYIKCARKVFGESESDVICFVECDLLYKNKVFTPCKLGVVI